MVHLGEEVSFDFVLRDATNRLISPSGWADYCAALIGDDRVEADADAEGHFQFTYRFDRVRPGQTVTVTAAAYRQRANRDFMKIAGRWYASDSPYEQADTKVASDSIRFTVYQPEIDLAVARGPDEFDPDTGVLRIRRIGGPTASIYIDRPLRPGFALTGPDPRGVYRVRYRPKADEVNPNGKTEVEFTIYDTAGLPHTLTTAIDTP
jgi:hypothetical protein